MSWSFRIGRFFGIDVFVHATFLLLLAWLVIASYWTSGSWAVALDLLVFVVIAFTIVVMHEYGHALTARAFAVPTRDITLLPIGGVARLERIPESPVQEFLIAVAGPAVNVVLAIILFVWIWADGTLAAMLRPPAEEAASPELVERLIEMPLTVRLFELNVALVLFNMIPAFPMDGGRVLRALLAMALDYVRATRIAAAIGQFVALLFGFMGLLSGQYMLVFIALFVWIGAAQEAEMVAQRSVLAGVPVRAAMITNFEIVSPLDTLESVARHVLDGFQHDFPVVDAGQVVGMMTRRELMKALAERGRHSQVAEVMASKFLITRPDEPLSEIVSRLQQCDCHSLPVLEGNHLVGVITAENIGEYMMIRSAAEANGRSGFPAA